MQACFICFSNKAATRIQSRICGSDRPQWLIGWRVSRDTKGANNLGTGNMPLGSNPCNCKNLFTFQILLKVTGSWAQMEFVHATVHWNSSRLHQLPVASSRISHNSNLSNRLGWNTNHPAEECLPAGCCYVSHNSNLSNSLGWNTNHPAEECLLAGCCYVKRLSRGVSSARRTRVPQTQNSKL